jgi:tRNA(Leu) C34 or U34 (ribose-2'-O)-methylase TrmL
VSARERSDQAPRGVVHSGGEEALQLLHSFVDDAQRGVACPRHLTRRLEHLIEHSLEIELGHERTADRHDYAVPPPRDTILDELKRAGLEVRSVGKIYDIFAERGYGATSIERLAQAAGVPVTETVVRISCGGAESVPVVSVSNMARFLAAIREEHGVRVVGTSDQGSHDLYASDFTGPLAIVLGAECKGMRRLTTENCDELVRIPMQGKVECLNVSNSAAVCLFEAVRQRSANSGS